jgi:hypothetical protein
VSVEAIAVLGVLRGQGDVPARAGVLRGVVEEGRRQAGSAARRLNAFAMAAAQGQSAGRCSVSRRAWRVRRPAVRPDFYRLDAGTPHHLQGAPPERERRVSTTTTLPAQANDSAPHQRQRRPRYRRIEARLISTVRSKLDDASGVSPGRASAGAPDSRRAWWVEPPGRPLHH